LDGELVARLLFSKGEVGENRALLKDFKGLVGASQQDMRFEGVFLQDLLRVDAVALALSLDVGGPGDGQL
jgi:hypothetical protein